MNTNTIPGNKCAMVPTALEFTRVPHAMTTRGRVDDDFALVGEFLEEDVDVAAEIQKTSDPCLSEFRKVPSF